MIRQLGGKVEKDLNRLHKPVVEFESSRNGFPTLASSGRPERGITTRRHAAGSGPALRAAARDRRAGSERASANCATKGSEPPQSPSLQLTDPRTERQLAWIIHWIPKALMNRGF